MDILKTILAYIIALILSPIFSALLSFIFLPIIAIPFFRNNFSKIILPIIMGTVCGLSVVWFGTVVFSWFSLTAGNMMLLLLALGFLQNDIYRIRTRRYIAFEYRHMFGDFFGIAIGALLFIWGYEFNQILLPIIIIISLILAFAYFSSKGNVEFWELLSAHPDEGYSFIKNSNAWFVVEKSEDTEYMSKDFEWDGPFMHYVPSLRKRIKLYGKVGEYEKSQEEFVMRMKQNS